MLVHHQSYDSGRRYGGEAEDCIGGENCACAKVSSRSQLCASVGAQGIIEKLRMSHHAGNSILKGEKNNVDHSTEKPHSTKVIQIKIVEQDLIGTRTMP